MRYPFQPSRYTLFAALMFVGCVNINNVNPTISPTFNNNINLQASEQLNEQAAVSIDDTRIIVETTDTNELLKIFSNQILDIDRQRGTALMQASDKLTLQALMKQLSLSSFVQYAEPDLKLELPPALPFRTQQVQETFQKLIQAPQAWPLVQGKSAVTIAVLDSGIDASLPVFSKKLIAGFDFVNNDNDPNDDNGHGSHVAGIVANTAGSANIQIMPLKVLGRDMRGSARKAAQAIRQAVNAGVKVLNLSLATTSDNNDLRQAVLEALDKNVVVVAAMGNGSSSAPHYPARLSNSGVIAVGAVNDNGSFANSYSNLGSWMSVSAPGTAILSSVPNTDEQCNRNNFICDQIIGPRQARVSGTSQATPQVSAMAALLLSINPTLTPMQIREIIQKTAKDQGEPGPDSQFGYGLLQMQAALVAAGASPPAVEKGPQIRRITATPFYVESGQEVKLSMDLQTSSSEKISYGWAAGDGKISGEGPQVTWTAPAPGKYQLIAGAQQNQNKVFASTSIIVFPRGGN